MSSRALRRRSLTAVWIYAAVACGILGTVVAARILGLDEFGVFATAMAAVGFFQVLLDLTVEESLTKYGFRYVAAEDWGRLRRLFRQMLLLKLVGGALATVILVAFAPFANELFGAARRGAGDSRRSPAPARPGAGERRLDRAPPAQPVRPARHVPGRLRRAPARRDRRRSRRAA